MPRCRRRLRGNFYRHRAHLWVSNFCGSGIALLFRLNKPLTVACTFISNPLFQPFIIFFSVELGCLVRHGSFQPLTLSTLVAMRAHSQEQFFICVVGSVALGLYSAVLGAR